MNIYLSVPLSVDYVPVPVPQPKPVNIRTRGARVQILTGTGTDDLNFIHGLPVSITKHPLLVSPIITLLFIFVVVILVFGLLIFIVVMCRLRPQARSQAKPGQKKPSQAQPDCWLETAFGLA